MGPWCTGNFIAQRRFFGCLFLKYIIVLSFKAPSINQGDLVMTRPTQLVLIRHGQSLRNEAINHQAYFPDMESMEPVKDIPDLKIPLTGKGLLQARQTGVGLLKKFKLPHYIYHSGFERTIQTMNGILEAFSDKDKKNVKIRMNPYIYERRSGYTYDMTTAQVDERFPWFKHQYELDAYFAEPPGGESMSSVVERVYHFVNMLFRDREGKRVWVILHGGTLKAMRFILERWTFDKGAHWPEGQSPKNCSVTYYNNGKVEERLILKGHNLVFWE